MLNESTDTTLRPHPLRRLEHRLRSELAGRRKLLFLAGGALLLEIGFWLAQPWPLKFFFDSLLGAPATGGASYPLSLLTIAALTLAGIWAARALVAGFGSNVSAVLGRELLAPLGDEAYSRLLRVAPASQARSGGRSLARRVCRDLSRLESLAESELRPLMLYTAVLLGATAMLLVIHWQLALFVGLTAPLFWLRSVNLARGEEAAARARRQQEHALSDSTAEALGSVREVQALSLERKFTSLFSRRHAALVSATLASTRAALRRSRSLEALLAAAVAAALWLAGELASAGQISIGEVAVFVAYLAIAYRPATTMPGITAGLRAASAAAERIMDILEQRPGILEAPIVLAAPPFQGDVHFDGVEFSYDHGPPVLVAIELHARPGQLVALVGPAGSGKSTLASLIPRLHDVTRGRLAIDGEDIRHYSLRSLRDQVSVILGDTLLFSGTVWDNIAPVASDVTRAEIEAAARLANAHDFISALPDGYDTMLGIGGVALPQGQRQRIGIARALVRPAPILVLDRPTDSLDEDDKRLVLDPLMRLARGRTTFLVTDDMHLAAVADHIVYVERGRLVEQGSHADLMRRDDRYAAVYRRQAAARSAIATRPQAVALTG